MDLNKKSPMRPFIIFSIILFVIILVGGSTAFIFSMQQIIKTNTGNELAQMIETERIRLESTLNSEIAIAIKLANSPVVRKHIMNPEDPVLERVAIEEIASYRKAFSGFSIFWLSSKDMLFHSDDNEPYLVDADDPVNYWYNMTIYETEVYNFNINYNPDLDEIKLWINAPVFDDVGKPVGMVGTGIDLSEFVDNLYRSIDDEVELYFFIDSGKIYASRDVGLIIDGANIEDVLPDIGIGILAETRKLEPGEKRLFDIPNGIAAIGAIPVLDWYYIGMVTYGINDADIAMTLLFLVMMLVILSIIVIFNLFISRFLKSLRKASENLASMAQKREQELVADNEMLDRLNRIKTEFFQNMSHDFKTPLTVISTSVLNATDMLDYEIEKGKVQESLSNAHNEIMRLARMVDSAMKYSSLQDNRQDMSELDLASLMRKGADTYRALLERNGNTLYLNIPPSLPPVYGNADMLLHVLSNILSNANRHTRDGRIAIGSTVENDMIIVEVRDNGAGIKPELLPYVFERGFSESGTGIGLSICKTAIEAHKGTITIDSEYGQGTTLTITLPVYYKPVEPETSEVEVPGEIEDLENE